MDMGFTHIVIARTASIRN